MKKKSIGILAGFLSVMLFAIATVGAFADDNIAIDNYENAETTVTGNISSDALSVNKSDYYSRIADLNQDWMLNSADARLILRKVLKLDWVKDPSWLPKGSVFGDVEENGAVSSADSRWVLRISLKLSTVPEAKANAKPVPSTTSSPSSATVTNAPITTVPPEPTTHVNNISNPICDEYTLDVTTSAGVKYSIATDGLNCYIKSSDIMSGVGVYIESSGQVYLVNEKDGEYTPVNDKAINAYKVDTKDIRKFVACLYVPEFDIFTDCTVTKELLEGIIPLTVATKDGVKFYFYADGSMEKITGKDFAGNSVDFSVQSFTYDAQDSLNITEKYSKANTTVFLLKNNLILSVF